MRKTRLVFWATIFISFFCFFQLATPQSAFAAGEVAIDDPNIAWSPYGWVANGNTYKQSPTVGSYVDIAFTGNTIGLNVDVSMLGGPVLPSNITISAYIDNDTPLTMSLNDVSANQLIFTNSLSNGTHYAHIVIESNTNYSSRWSYSGGDPLSLLRITSLQLNGSGITNSLQNTPIYKLGPKIIYFGDSITEGNGVSAGSYGSSSTAANVGKLLNSSYGIHGYESLTWWSSIFSNTTDFTYPISDTMNFPAAVWNNNYHGSSLLNNLNLPSSGFKEGAPDAIFNNLGINDINLYSFFGVTALNNYASNIQDWLEQTRFSLGARPAIFMVMPFNYNCTSLINSTYNSTQESTLQLYRQKYIDTIANYKANNSDNRVFLIDLGVSGCQTVVDNSTDNLHPNKTGAILLGERIANLSKPNIILDTPLTANVNNQALKDRMIVSSLVALSGTAPGNSTITISTEPGGHVCTTIATVDGTWTCKLESLIKNMDYKISVSAYTTYGQYLYIDDFTVIYTGTVSSTTSTDNRLAETGIDSGMLMVIFILLMTSAIGNILLKSKLV